MRLYPDGLVQRLKGKKYIPRLIRPDEELKLGRKYYEDELKSFKVVDKYKVKDETYYSIFCEMGRNHTITYHKNREIYELCMFENSLKGSDIINDNKFYNGYEIIYWFFINNIDFNDMKYKKFYSYVEYNGKSCIAMNKRYRVHAVLGKAGYYSIKFVCSYRRKR